jgi:hypothetical protein
MSLSIHPRRFFGAVIILCAVIWAWPLSAQYFGQNKVRYHTYDFEVLETEHFEIYFYPQEREAIEHAARMAERWYARLSRILQHQLSSRQPVIFYATQTDFQNTTVVPGVIGETTGGLTEGLRRRIVMPLAGPLAETDHVLGHELVHAFQYDIGSTRSAMTGGQSGLETLPLWFIEGMAEYLSLGPVDAHTAMWMRDAVARGEVPPIEDLDDPDYFPYRYGHAFWAFVGGRYGDEVIGTMLKYAAQGGSPEGAIQAVLRVPVEELSETWRAFLAERNRPLLQTSTDAGASGSGQVLVSQPEGGGEINASPSISPDGRRMLFFSQKDLFSIELYLADAQTGEIQEKITDTVLSPHYNNLQFVNSSGAWSRDGGLFAYSHVVAGRGEIAVYDVEQGEKVRDLLVSQTGEVFSPTWSPDGSSIAVSVKEGGITDLYVVEIETGAVRRLTSDAYADLQPSWSPDGASLAFVTDRFTSDLSALSLGDYRLGLLDVRTGQSRRLSSLDVGKQIDPQWSADGSSLYFISDHTGVSNIYRLSVADNVLHQVTDVRTGVSGITHLSPAMSVANSGRVIYSVYSNHGYTIEAAESPERIRQPQSVDAETRARIASLAPQEEARGRVASALAEPREGLISGDAFETRDYSAGLGLEYVAPPSIAVGSGSFGTFVGGGTALHFADMLGFHNLTLAFESNFTTDGNILRNLSGVAHYRNQRHRWIWGVSGGQVPLVSGFISGATAIVDGEPVFIEESVTQWQIERQLMGVAAYPFSRAQRIEFTTGYQNIAFASQADTIVVSALTGEPLFEESVDLDAPGSLHMAAGSSALVYDTSLFGGTSPVAGQSYRFEAGYAAGSINFYTALADYRRYLHIARPLSLAGRVMHFGRYGGGAEDIRLQDLFLGYPSLVRGYDSGSFRPQECGPTLETTGACPVFDRLLGSRVAVANAELRLQVLGPLGLLRTRSLPPIELAPFYDAGLAWSSSRSADLLRGSREVVTSYGASARFNVFGYFVGQVSYAIPNDRPQRAAVWSFSFLPGF